MSCIQTFSQLGIFKSHEIFFPSFCVNPVLMSHEVKNIFLVLKSGSAVVPLWRDITEKNCHVQELGSTKSYCRFIEGS